jgi:hypothetical protein
MSVLSSWFERVVRRIVRHYGWVLVVASALTVVGVRYTMRLPMQSDLAALLPADRQSVRTLEAVTAKVGGFETLRILLVSDDFSALTAYAARLARALEASEPVKLVEYRRATEFFARHALLYAPLEELRQIRTTIADRVAVARSPLGVGLRRGDALRSDSAQAVLQRLADRVEEGERPRYYANRDRTVLALDVIPAGAQSDLAFARHFFAEVRAIVDATPPEGAAVGVQYGGSFKSKIDEYEVIMGDVRFTAAIALTMTLLLIVAYFRQPAAALFIGVPLLMSLSWTFGLTYLVIGELNTVTVFLFAILFGLGIDFGIHVFARYMEERRGGLAPPDAVQRTLHTTGRALFTSALTTSVAFYSFLLADFKVFSQFGFIAGTGVLSALVAMTVVAPATIRLSERFHLVRSPRAPPAPSGNLPRAVAWMTLVVGLGGALWGITALDDLRFQYDFTDLRVNPPDRADVGRKLAEIFPESSSPAAVLVGGREDAAALTRTLATRAASDSTPTVDKVRSLYTALPDSQDAKLGVIREIRALLDDPVLARRAPEYRDEITRLRALTDVEALVAEDLPEQVKRPFRAKDGTLGQFAYVYPSVALRDGRNAIAFAADVGEIRTDDGRTFHAVNSSIIFADMLVLVREEGVRSVMITFAAVFLLVLFDLRRLAGTLLVLAPLAVGLLWLVGAMAVLDLEINLFNMVAIPTLIGIGVDNGVHLYHRYRLEGEGSIVRVLRHTGLAVVLSSVTTMVGFSGLVLAHHPGLNSIGVLALLGIGTTMVAALTVLPAVLRLEEPRRPAAHPTAARADVTG